MTTNDAPLDELTRYMQQQRANTPNLQFSEAKQAEYVGRINNLGTTLRECLAKIHGIEGDVGYFASAIDTKSNLTADIQDIQNLLNGYLGFISEFAQAVQAAGHNIQATDRP
jgi:hypothetical protein